MFQWLWDRITDRIFDSAIQKLEDKEFIDKVLTPLIDSIADREIARFTKGEGLKGAIPKFDVKDLIGILAMKLLGGNLGGPQALQEKALDRPLTNRQLEVK